MSPLPPTKYGGTSFEKKLCMGEQTFVRKFIRGCFTWGLMIRSDKWGREWFRGFKDPVKLLFLSMTLAWVIDKLFETLTPLIGD